MKQYLDLLKRSLFWEPRPDRTGTGTLSTFSADMKFDLREGFPLLTTKKLHWKSISIELLWFISGDTNTDYLLDNGVTIWNEWADENGNLGPIYGHQWRKWRKFRGLSFRNGTGIVDVNFDEIDQLQNCIDRIKNNPFDRRHIVSAWNVANLEDMALPPCHLLYQFYVSTDKRYLDIKMYQRSVDIFLGLPYNIASYSLLLKMVAQQTGLIPRYFYWTSGDTHLYINHIEQAKEQIERTPTDLPTVLLVDNVPTIDDYEFDDIILENYVAQPHIKAEISI